MTDAPRVYNNKAALYGALAKAQSAMPSAIFNRTNPHFKSKYADLTAIRDATIPALSANGLAIAQVTEYEGNRLILRTILAHETGATLESTYPLPIDKPQVMGSAITYAKRYTWSALCGISADDDDDGNAAQEGGKAKAGKAVTAPPAEPVIMDWSQFDLTKTKAAEQLRALGRMIKDDDQTQSIEVLDAHIADHQALIEAVMQCSDWWDDAERQIQLRRDELRNRTENPMEGA